MHNHSINNQTNTCINNNLGGLPMSKVKSRDKGGMQNGKSKGANNNRDLSGKLNNSNDSTNNALKNTGDSLDHTDE